MSASFLPIADIKDRLFQGAYDRQLTRFYGLTDNGLQSHRQRIADALDAFRSKYGDLPVRVFSVSGRTELGGNHTDHQHGCVLAGAITLDILAVAAHVDAREIRVQSEGYAEDIVSLDCLSADKSMNGTSAALIRGTAAQFASRGVSIGGLCVYTVSDVLKGSGVSSSAAFEVLLGTICNDFFAENRFSPVEIAKIAQYAENCYFGKPCGLMDQAACALGGVMAIDFDDPAQPVVRSIPLDLSHEGYALCIIDSRADHADLTDEYTAIPAEMQAVAYELGADYLRDADPDAFWRNLIGLRKKCSDRAILRAIHFFDENQRVDKQVSALVNGDFSLYLQLVNESGRSSAMLLQNLYASNNPHAQGVTLALAAAAHFLGGEGAFRVHGGGFAGTVQAYVPLAKCESFREKMDAVFGTGACHVLQIRAAGASALWN